MGKKIATVITDMFEDVEYADPAKAFKDAGHNVIAVGDEKGKNVTGKNNEETVTIDEAIDNARPEDFDALFIPGGFSPDILRADDRYVKFAKQFMDDNKPVFSICHGAQLLINARVLDGRDATGFESIHVDLENAGANVHDKEVVVCSNQLVTSRNPNDIPAFNKEALKLLAD